jgi:hypothetical protein
VSLPPTTLVLVHGLAVRHRPESMFRGVEARLSPLGRVARPLIPGDGTLETLTARLAAQLDALDGPLALLCHSMGGLLARQLVMDPSWAPRLRAVVTLGTPHEGSPLARVAVAFGRAYRDCTVAARRAWTARNAPSEAAAIETGGIRCGSLVAHVPCAIRTSWLRPTQLLLDRLCGEGDGIVPAAAQAWGADLGSVDLDHAESVLLGTDDAAHARALDAWERMARFALGRT